MTLTEQNDSNDFWRKWLAEDPTEARACMAAMPKAKLTLGAPRALTAEDLHQKIGENGLLMPGFATTGIQILQDGTGNRNMVQELPPTFHDLTQDATDTTTVSDLSTAIGLCAACGPKLDMYLANLKKRPVDDDEPLFDSTGRMSKVAAITPPMTQEDYRMTSAGLLTPEMSENPFQEDGASLTLSGVPGVQGLRRPDAFPDETLAQLRELMLAKPVQKSRERKISLEELRKLGWLGGEHDDTTEMVPSHQVAAGGLIIPE
jgi:hypothetical protein